MQRASLWLFGFACLTFVTAGPTTRDGALVSKRPPPDRRTFRSDAVEKLIVRLTSRIKDPELAWLVENCLPNTLDTTVDFAIVDGRPDTFIITGDIDAMWLRDSSAQVQTYLPLCPADAHLAQMIAGLIRRQATFIRLDPYANAFYKNPTRESEWRHDKTLMKPGVHERKWELDSLCYPIRLACEYWKITGDRTPFDADWRAAMRLAVATMIEQQRVHGDGPYTFGRGGQPATAGPAYRPTGMICSAFRASDDPVTYPFNIPENLFAIASLRELATMLDALADDRDGLAATCRALAGEVEAGVLSSGVVDRPGGVGKIYAYECDGLGHFVVMDDANMPNLTSIPYLGYKTIADPLYRNTRAFAQSASDPLFVKGTAAEGVGSAHVRGPNIWPMGIVGRALTSDDDAEIRACLAMLESTNADTGFMHESFKPNDPTVFTRKWFAWANNLFGDLIVKLDRERPWLLTGDAAPTTR